MKTRLMKTSIRGASVALLVSAGLLLLVVSGIQGSGRRSSADGFECADATIRGTYGTQMQGTGPVPPPVGGTQTVIGVVTRTYDGMGNFTQIDNIHGSVTGWVLNRPGSGTYQVNPDCTFATQFVPGPGAPVIEERGVIVDHGKELYTARELIVIVFRFFQEWWLAHPSDCSVPTANKVGEGSSFRLGDEAGSPRRPLAD